MSHALLKLTLFAVLACCGTTNDLLAGVLVSVAGSLLVVGATNVNQEVRNG